jgi:hypothetical protein
MNVMADDPKIFKVAEEGVGSLLYKIMATHFPKVTMRIYEHVLLMHVHTLLNHGSRLDGSSWFLEAYSKVWKQQRRQLKRYYSV